MSEVLFFFIAIMVRHFFQKQFLNLIPNVFKRGKYCIPTVPVSSHVLDQIIWNNKFLKISGKFLCRWPLDIFDREDKFLKWNMLKGS